MLGRVREAVADAAETLRRAFSDLAVTTVVPEPFQPQGHGSAGLGVVACPGLEPPLAEVRVLTLLREAVEGRALAPFQAVLQAEAGWDRWGAEATVVQMTPLEAGRAARLSVPALPRKANALGRVDAPIPPGVRRWADPLGRPGTRRLPLAFERAVGQPGLGVLFRLPQPVKGVDIQRLPKGLWMRYSLQLVRGTGENVRNLEVIGLFRIPRKGVADLRHDPRLGRLLLHLEPVAASAPRAPFILAKRKDDDALVSCFVEDP